MFKSILAKYIAAVSLIVLISFLILATVLTAIVGDYGQKMRREDVEHISDIAARIVTPDPDADPAVTLKEHIENDPNVRETFDMVCSEDISSSIFLVDAEQNVLLASKGFSSKAKAVVADSAYWSRVNAHIEKGIPYRQTEKVAALGKSSYLVYVTPLNGADGEYLGCLYAVTSIASVEQISAVTIRTATMSCLWIMLAVLIALYFITERTVNPIRRMRSATQAYAKGDFSKRVEVVGSDEIAELAHALNTMAAELDSLEQNRNRFISDVSHELRSPMTSMLGFVEAVADGSCPPEKRSYYLSLVAEEIKRLSRLVADLLDVSRLEMGEKKMNLVRYDICDNAATVLISLEQRINEKRLDVSFEAEEDRIYVRADADAMYRVLYNLIENAVKFSRPEGKLSVKLSTVGHDVSLEVYNEGIGISAEDLPNVFDRFYKSDKSRGEDKKGVGLGLYFVKTIVTAHGGTIRAESTEGEFCRFTVELPLYKDKDKNKEKEKGPTE